MDKALRSQVERLIIENRNSLNDPTTNEPYDVKGIADDVVELIQAAQQQLLTELEAEAIDYDLVTYDFGTALVVGKQKAVPVSLIENKRKEIS